MHLNCIFIDSFPQTNIHFRDIMKMCVNYVAIYYGTQIASNIVERVVVKCTLFTWVY